MPDFQSETARGLYAQLMRDCQLVEAHPAGGLEQLILHVSSACNLRCSYCFATQGTYGGESPPFLAPETARACVDALLQRVPRIERIKFFGGEPLLALDAVEAVCSHLTRRWEEGALAHLPHFHINTNLTMSPDRVAALVRTFGLSVTVGIDGPAEIHDVLRHYPDGRGSFAAVDENIRKLMDSCDQPRSLEAVYTPEHARRGLRPVAVHRYLAERYKGRVIFIHPHVRPFLADGVRWPSATDEPFEKGALRELFLEYGQFLGAEVAGSSVPLSQHAYTEDLFSAAQTDCCCSAGTEYLALTTAGDVYPCSGLCGRREFWMGHAGPQSPVDEERFSRTRLRFAQLRKSAGPVCGGCAIMKTCSSCLAAMLDENGDFRSPVDRICEFRIGLTEGRLLALAKLLECSGDQAPDGHDLA